MRLIETALIGLVFIGASYGLFWVRRWIRSTPANKSQDVPLRAAALVCLVLFIVVNLSDWPGTVLADFWAQHAILSATASTLPLVGVGYFAFEAHDQRTQDRLDRSVAATGRGGVVDHLVDIDVALALIGWEHTAVKRRWPTFDDREGRPLRWLRQERALIGRDAVGAILPTDPRRSELPHEARADLWQRDLVDQCIRRVMAGIKEWGPILSRSSDGQQDLIDLGDIRLGLLPLADHSRPLSMSDMKKVQRQCRALALAFEERSGVTEQNLRSELLLHTERIQ